MKTFRTVKTSTLKTAGIALLAALSLLASCRNKPIVRPIPEPATPTIDFAWAGQQTAPTTVAFTNNTQNATDYRWDLGNGQISTLHTPMPTTYTQPGSYDVILVATNGNKQAVLKKTLVIATNADPVAHFSFTFKDQKNFAPATVNFFNESVNATTYEWEINGVLYITVAPSNIVFTLPGNYKVRLTAIKNGIRSAVFEDTVTVVANSSNPTASFVLAYHPYPYTTGELIQFVNRSLNADAWEWDFGANGPAKSTQEHPLVKFDKAGVHTITLIAKKNGIASAPRSINLKIN